MPLQVGRSPLWHGTKPNGFVLPSAALDSLSGSHSVFGELNSNPLRKSPEESLGWSQINLDIRREELQGDSGEEG